MGEFMYILYEVKTAEEVMRSKDINDIFSFLGKKTFGIWEFETHNLPEIKVSRQYTRDADGNLMINYTIIYDCTNEYTELNYLIRRVELTSVQEEDSYEETAE